MKLAASCAVLVLAWASAACAEVPRVVATIKPLHSLVAAVMGDLGSPDLIVRGGTSPHTYSLRPSDARALEAADVVFWAGHGMELFLEDALETIAVDATVIALADAPGLDLLPIRAGGAFEAHDHDEAGHDHDHDEPEGHDDDDGHDGIDMHYWLDPVNAAAMASAIAGTLSAADPENAATYSANAASLAGRLDVLASELDIQLAPVREVPFVVFHDAYQYFERRFGLAAAGAITVTPDKMPGAARIAEIRERIAGSGAACVFAEPQFEPAVVDTVIEGTATRAAVLDPEGSTLPQGPDLYETLVRNLATSLIDCLSAD